MYKVKFTKDGIYTLSKLPKNVISQIKEKILWLSINTEEISHIMLKGNEFKNIFKLRTSDYRILYDLDKKNKTITIIRIGHRKDIYKL